MKKPHHDNRKTRPYKLKGLTAGIDLALWLTGLISGAFHNDTMNGGMASMIPSVQFAKEPTSLIELE